MKLKLITLIAMGLGAANATTVGFIDWTFGNGIIGNFNNDPSGLVSSSSTTQAGNKVTFNITFDATSVGGTALETVAFDLDFSSSTGTVNYNNSAGFGYGVGTTGTAEGDQITAALSVSSANSYVSNLTFTSVDLLEIAGGLGEPDVSFSFNNGETSTLFDPQEVAMGLSTSGLVTGFTVSNVDTDGTGQAFNVGGVGIQFDVVAVPEPTSAALLGLGGLALITRRKR